MDLLHRGFHRRLLGKRQGLGGGIVPVGGLFPTASPSSPAPSQATPPSATLQSTAHPATGGITSLVGDATTLILPSSGPFSDAPSSTPLTPSSSSSTGSTTSSSSSVKTTSVSSTSSTTSTSTTSPTPTPTPTSAPATADVVYTSSDGTRIVYITSTPPVASATAAPSTSFLQNPSLEGGVFALVGIVVLIIIFIVVTWTIRKRRRDRLERDLAVAVTFDPGATEHYERQENSIEKRLSGGSSGHGQNYGYGYAVQPTYVPQQEYHGPMRYPAPAYRPPSPNAPPFREPSPASQHFTGQGGANLTRKFSDRKPVPPLLPNHTYDPANSHVSIPPQFYPP